MRASVEMIKGKILLLTVLTVFTIACYGQTTNSGNSADSKPTANSDKYKLPSGHEIKVTAVNEHSFPNGETALILQYQTSIPIENLDELKKEVHEVWTIFRVDVEKAKVDSGIIRATYITDDGAILKKGKGYGFVYLKDANGKWYQVEGKK